MGEAGYYFTNLVSMNSIPFQSHTYTFVMSLYTVSLTVQLTDLYADIHACTCKTILT